MPATKLPLPDEQPVAVNALRIRRARAAGEIEMHNREIDRLRTEILHLDFVLRLFDPDTEPADVGIVNVRPRRTEWFARGEVTLRIYSAIRAHGSMSPRELAKSAMADKAIPESDRLTRKDIISRFANVAHDLARKGKLAKVGSGPGVRFKLAEGEPDLI